MLFRLVEELFPNYLYYAGELRYKGELVDSPEGHHFTQNAHDARVIAPQLTPAKDAIYRYRVDIALRPLLIDADATFWSATNIAELLLCRLNDEAIDSVKPEDIHINNLTEDDREFLESFKSSAYHSTSAEFDKMMDFIATKGHNCIEYNTLEKGLYKKALLFSNKFEVSNTTLISYIDNGEWKPYRGNI